jgi:hypothetical protein
MYHFVCVRHNYIPSVIALTAHIPSHKLFEPLILDVAFELADTPSLFTLKDCMKSMLLQIQF